MTASDRSGTRRGTATGDGRYKPPSALAGDSLAPASAARARRIFPAVPDMLAPRRPHGHRTVSRQASAIPVRAVIGVQRSVRVVRSYLLRAEDQLRAGQLFEAGRCCRAAMTAVAPITVVEPDLHASVLAVHAHVSVAAGSPTAVEAVRRYYAAAVDRALEGVGERLVYADGLRAVLLATTRPALAADNLDTLLQQPPGSAMEEMLARALIAVHDVWSTGPATPAGPPPLIPGGAHLTAWAVPDPDCLAWLIHATAPDGPSATRSLAEPVDGQQPAAQRRDHR